MTPRVAALGVRRLPQFWQGLAVIWLTVEGSQFWELRIGVSTQAPLWLDLTARLSDSLAGPVRWVNNLIAFAGRSQPLAQRPLDAK
jgi:hypothetical protein